MEKTHFEVLAAYGSDEYIICKACANKFWVDPTTNENLIRVGRELKPLCPHCKRIGEVKERS